MTLLNVENLNVTFQSKGPSVKAVKDVSFSIERGQIMGLVGESGSGKSVTGLALMGLHDPKKVTTRGSATLDGDQLLNLSRGPQKAVRGVRVSMIFQEPMTALDPVFKIGHQLVETLKAHFDMTYAEAKERSIQMLDKVGIANPSGRFHSYPHEMSGGMRQRVMIAIAMLGEPDLLIADEPTTAVDATIQVQLLRLIKTACAETDTAVLFITHDLGVVSQLCDKMATMYAGEIVETGLVRSVLAQPHHPYTKALLDSLPDPKKRHVRLTTIPGAVPSPGDEPDGCLFSDRCQFVTEACRIAKPSLRSSEQDRFVRCIRWQDLAADRKGELNAC